MDNLFRTLIPVTLASLLASCAIAPDRSGDEWGSADTIKVMEYLVKPGDSLAGISRKLTGNIDNWTALAEFNRIADPSIIQVGDTVLIPAELFPPERQAQAEKVVPVNVAFNQIEPDTQVQDDIDIKVPPSQGEAPKVVPPVEVATGATAAAVFQRSALPGATWAAVTLRPVVVDRTFRLSRTRPLAARTLATQTRTTSATGSASGTLQVEVAGNERPKSIFAQPFNHSPLLMQAKPGTTFTVDQQLGDWLRIKTEKGAGYIRRRDAKMIGASYTPEVIPKTALG